eukprot:3940388-Rhodomonas_salina.3
MCRTRKRNPPSTPQSRRVVRCKIRNSNSPTHSGGQASTGSRCYYRACLSLPQVKLDPEVVHAISAAACPAEVNPPPVHRAFSCAVWNTEHEVQSPLVLLQCRLARLMPAGLGGWGLGIGAWGLGPGFKGFGSLVQSLGSWVSRLGPKSSGLVPGLATVGREGGGGRRREEERGGGEKGRRRTRMEDRRRRPSRRTGRREVICRLEKGVGGRGEGGGSPLCTNVSVCVLCVRRQPRKVVPVVA